jgi:molybdopterin-guanine dinucleotide biosynthesis protein A
MSRDETALYDPGFRAFVNINTADDLARAQEMEQDKGR